jgi:ABC-type branched-subunit amino acid transport system ATPase component
VGQPQSRGRAPASLPTRARRGGHAPSGDGAPLRAESVGKRFAGVEALRSVDLVVEPDDFVGLIGPNGSGKTTLVNILSGFLRPSAGRVELAGVDVSGWPPYRVARLGLCRTFQNVRLFPRLSVRENVEVGATGGLLGARGRQARERASAAMEELGVAEHVDRLASELPYGTQRRVDIARALAGQPRFLLLDEPAAGLNDAETEALGERIAQVGRSHGLGVLVIDHDLGLITSLCRHVVVLDTGSVIAAGSPDDVTTNPAVIEAYLGAPPTRAIDGPDRSVDTGGDDG